MPTKTLHLPAMNEEPPLEELKEICEHYQLQELWKKLRMPRLL